jgi:hypothetical protein
MTKHSCRFLAPTILLMLGPAVATFAQTALTQLRTELVSPWLVTVEGEARPRILKILDLGERSEGIHHNSNLRLVVFSAPVKLNLNPH